MSLLKATTQQEISSTAGPDAYENGDGYSVSTDLARVDEADASTDASGVEARVTSVASYNTLVVKMYSTESGDEYAQGADLSDDTVVYEAYKL